MSLPKKFSVIDIETTGGLAKRDRITEVGIVTIQNGEIIDQFQTLVQPERSIPAFITRITGIDDEMVRDAPKFYEVAKEIVERTQGCIFVAHNVRFDYGFIQAEFKRLGYSYSRRKLCTCSLSKKLMPGLKSYSLKNLCVHHNISLVNHHRALDDAKAAAEILIHLLTLDKSETQSNAFINRGIMESRLPTNISLDDLHALPEEPGVYYFYDQDGALLYIGKSKHIQKRVMEHFSATTRKAEHLQQRVHSIDYVLTGNELHAMLLESAEIKKHLPPINKAQKRSAFPFQVVMVQDESVTYHALTIERKTKSQNNHTYIKSFTTTKHAKRFIQWVSTEFDLCSAVNGLSPMGSPCDGYRMHKCLGACLMEEPPEDYNARVKEFMQLRPEFPYADFIILDKGRNEEEQGVVVIMDHQYYGHGYIDSSITVGDTEDLLEHISQSDSSDEIHSLIGQYINEDRSTHRLIPM